MASIAVSAVLCVLFSSAKPVYSMRKLGASDECSGGVLSYVGQVIRIKSTEHQYWLGNGCEGSLLEQAGNGTSLLDQAGNSTSLLGQAGRSRSRSRSSDRSRSGYRCGHVPILGNFLGHVMSGSWQVVKGEGQTVMLRSCVGHFLHSPLGQRHRGKFTLDSSTSVGSRWCMRGSEGNMYFQSARSGRFLSSMGQDATVRSDDHQSSPTQWQVSAINSCPTG